MPDLEQHCARALKNYGVEARDIHSWLDDPSKTYVGSHRQFRHDTETVKLVGEIFGKIYGKELAENIALDHIMADHEGEIRNRDSSIIINMPQTIEAPSIPCSYCRTLLRPSDQKCPNCGASRTSIIEQFDRAIEIEKIEIRKKKKQLKHEILLEQNLRKKTLQERLMWYALNPAGTRDPVCLKIFKEDMNNIGAHPELAPKYLKILEIDHPELVQMYEPILEKYGHNYIAAEGKKQKAKVTQKRIMLMASIIIAFFAFIAIYFAFESPLNNPIPLPYYFFVGLGLLIASFLFSIGISKS